MLKNIPSITAPDRKQYALKTEKDKEIFLKCKELEGMEMSKTDRILVSLIKTQLRMDWRKPLLKALHGLRRKYR